MEARLGAAGESRDFRAESAPPAAETEKEAVAPGSVQPQAEVGRDEFAPDAAPPLPDEGVPAGFDDAAESAFRAEARERGDVVPTVAATEAVEEVETTALPPLNELVQRIPGEVRDVLDELFRAKFVAVRRIPKQSLHALRQ